MLGREDIDFPILKSCHSEDTNIEIELPTTVPDVKLSYTPLIDRFSL
jgi:hypothetical protein